MVKNISGRINLKREMPEDFMATNSKLSLKFPKVIMDEIKIAIGIASIRSEALAYQINCAIVIKSSPFPTKSSIYFHKLCIINTKNPMKKVMMKGPINDFSISLSNFFIMFTVLLRYVAILKFTRLKNSALIKALLKSLWDKLLQNKKPSVIDGSY